jgi:branched-chain amino acid transport system ATP-binding protein
VFATLTVDENLALSIHRIRGKRQLRAGLNDAYDLFPRLAERRTQAAGTLSGGEQRMLALARVLVDAPMLLIADELSLGLAPLIIESVYESLARIRDAGTALLVIEQHVSHALELCDRVAILSHGTVDWQGPTEDAHQRVQAFLYASTHADP